jgi:hypothetical protein
MNITFTLTDPALEKSFLEQAKQRGLIELKGHRSNFLLVKSEKFQKLGRNESFSVQCDVNGGSGKAEEVHGRI